MVTTSLSYRAIGKTRLINLPVVNWNFMLILSALICFLLFVFYIFSINQITQGTYLIKNYNKEIINLSKENKTINVSFLKTGPLDQVHQKAKELGFEKTIQIKYVEISDNSLAKAE